MDLIPQGPNVKHQWIPGGLRLRTATWPDGHRTITLLPKKMQQDDIIWSIPFSEKVAALARDQDNDDYDYGDEEDDDSY
jgi:hypothetical protein